MTAKRKYPALTSLKGALYLLDDSKMKKPSAEFLGKIRELVTDAIEVLQTPDPMQRRIGFILLAFQQSTSVELRKVNGKLITRVTITDQTIYNWAMEEVHAIAGVKA
jgi:hypothetical protein